jgi:glycosyltransferase involved in cell wall biosynthesis
METKGVVYLLEALSHLKESGRAAKAIIIGTGPLENELRSYVEKHDLQEDVVFNGWVDQSKLPAYYATADVFAGPSLYEAQGLVFVEALASGIPVITTVGNGPDDFVEDSVNGYLVKPKSSQELFEKLTQLYDNPALLRRMKAAAPVAVNEKFAWKTAADSYIKSWRQYL